MKYPRAGNVTYRPIDGARLSQAQWRLRHRPPIPVGCGAGSGRHLEVVPSFTFKGRLLGRERPEPGSQRAASTNVVCLQLLSPLRFRPGQPRPTLPLPASQGLLHPAPRANSAPAWPEVTSRMACAIPDCPGRRRIMRGSTYRNPVAELHSAVGSVAGPNRTAAH